jgi:hypothetical protein
MKNIIQTEKKNDFIKKPIRHNYYIYTIFKNIKDKKERKMLRRKIKKMCKYETHTPIKINNYNQFLKNLDKYQNHQKDYNYFNTSNNPYKKKESPHIETNNDTDEIINETSKKIINKIIQRCSKQYMYGNLNNNSFHGLGKNDNVNYISNINNPNHDNDDLKYFYHLFESSPLKSITSMKSSDNNIKIKLDEITNENNYDTNDTMLCMNKYNSQKKKIELKYINIDVQL